MEEKTVSNEQKTNTLKKKKADSDQASKFKFLFSKIQGEEEHVK